MASGRLARPVSPRAQVVVALGAVYLIWGSTYLAIHFAIQTLPPFLMAGVRFVLAGLVLLGWAAARGVPRPTRRQVMAAALVGLLLPAIGNGTVVFVEQSVPSGITALLVGLVPLWVVVLQWLRPGGMRPRGRVIVGVALGFGGVALLATQGSFSGQAIHPLAWLLVLSSLAWAAGSLYAEHATLPASPTVSSGVELLAGGVVLLVVSLITGEPGQVHLHAISLGSAAALLYLILFGSLIAFSAYSWLLRAVPPALASTYAFVNPVVAVFLGWALAGEPLTLYTVAATLIIISAVALITTQQRRAPHPQTPSVASAEGAAEPHPLTPSPR